MMKRLNRWLNEHAFVWPWEDEREGVVHLWALFLTPILMFAAYFIFADITIPFQIMLGLPAILPPIIAGIKALVTKTKWNPWYWFPIVIGTVIGGIFACLLFWIIFL